MNCTHCNGTGYTGIRNGDDDIQCTCCEGTGTVSSQLTFEEARAICRCWNWGGKVAERLHDEALEVMTANTPPLDLSIYRTVDDDFDVDGYRADKDAQFEWDVYRWESR